MRLLNVLYVTAVFLLTISCSASKTNKKSKPGAVNQNVVMVIETTHGNVTVLLSDQTPQHRDNFIKLAEQNFYNGIIFHRVINKFMIQGGDPDSKNPKPGECYGNGSPGYTIPAEIETQLIHKKGALAAARTGNDVNPYRKSSGSQFYIVQGKVYTHAELEELEHSTQKKNPAFKFSPEAVAIYTTIGGTPWLDREYTVFGEVLEGIETVDKISNLPTSANNRPDEDVIILSIKRK